MMPGLSTAGTFVGALLPDLVLAGGTLLLLLLTVARPQQTVMGRAEGAERTGFIARVALGIVLVVGATVAISWANAVPGTADQRIAGDGFRWAIDLIVIAGTACTLMLLDTEHEKSHAFGPEIPVLLLLSLSGMMLLAAARDLMLVFLGVELMSLAVYVLAAVNRRSARGAEAAIKYFLLGAFSTGFMLYGMALLFGATGSTKLADIATWNAANPAGSTLFMTGSGPAARRICVQGCRRTVPPVDARRLRRRAASRHGIHGRRGQNSSVRNVRARVLRSAGRFGRTLARGVVVVGRAHDDRGQRVRARAKKSHAARRVFEHCTCGLPARGALLGYSQASSTAIVFYLVAYTLTTMGTFGVLIAVNGGRDQSPTLADVTGLWQSRPMLAVAMAVFMLSFLGMPLVGGMGFFAKWYVLQAALQQSAPQTVLAVILVLSSVVSAGYYLSVVSAMFMKDRPDHIAIPPAPRPMATALIAFTVIALLVLGVYPTPVSDLARRSAPAGAPTPGVSAAAQLAVPVSTTATSAALHP